MKPIWELFWATDFKLLKIIHISVEAGILLMHEQTDSQHKELLGLLLEPLWGPNMEKYMNRFHLNPHIHIQRDYMATVPGHIVSVTFTVWCPNTDPFPSVAPLIKPQQNPPRRKTVKYYEADW
jgi:hypothetical protein